jgi:hypothetical protein
MVRIAALKTNIKPAGFRGEGNSFANRIMKMKELPLPAENQKRSIPAEQFRTGR